MPNTIETLFDVLKQAICSNNSDRIPNTINKIRLLLQKNFLENYTYNFAEIIYHFIEQIKLIQEKKCYEKLAMLFNLTYSGSLNLINIIKKEHYAILPAIIFNQCDLNNQSQIHSIDSAKIVPFKMAVYQCLKDRFNIDVKSFFEELSFSQTFNSYLQKDLFEKKIFNQMIEFSQGKYLSDLFFYKVEYMLLTNNIASLAEDIVNALKKINLNKLLETLELLNDDFKSIPLLSFSFISECARHNGISALQLQKFRFNLYHYLKEHHHASMDEQKIKFKGLLLFSTSERFFNLLAEINSEVTSINKDKDTIIDFTKLLPKIKKLTNEVLAHCILAVYKNDVQQFSNYIGSFVDMSVKFPVYIKWLLLILFSPKYMGKNNYNNIINLGKEELTKVLTWRLINSDYMNLLKINKNNARSFKEYQDFKLAVYNIMLPNYETLIPFIDIELLLQDIYELQDSKRYILLVNSLQNKVNQLLASGKQVEVMHLLKLANNEEFPKIFMAFDQKNQLLPTIIDLTLQKMQTFFLNENFLTDDLYDFNQLWKNSNAQTDYLLDLEKFRQEIYKYSNYSEEEIQKISYLSFLLITHDDPWSEMIYNNQITKEAIVDAYPDFFNKYKNIHATIKQLDYKEITQFRTIRRKLLDYAEFINDSRKCAAIIAIDVNLLQYAYQNNIQAKIYYLLGISYKSIKSIHYLMQSLQTNLLSSIKLALLVDLSFTNNSFYLAKQERTTSAWPFKKEVFKLLGLNEYDLQINELKNSLFIKQEFFQLNRWLALKINFKIIEWYMLYCEDFNSNKLACINFGKDLIEYINNKQIRQQIFTNPLINKDLLNYLLSINLHNANDIPWGNFINYLKIPSYSMLTKDQLFPENIKHIKVSLLGWTAITNFKERLTKSLNKFIIAINQDKLENFFEAVFFIGEIDEILDDMLLQFDPQNLATVAVQLTNHSIQLGAEIIKNCFKEPIIWNITLTNKQQYLLAINIANSIYKKHEQNLQYRIRNGFVQQKIQQFLLKTYQHIEQILEILNSPEQLLDTLTVLEVQDVYKAYETIEESIIHLEKTFLTNDFKIFAKIIDVITSFLIKLYNNNQIASILECLKFNKTEDLYTIFRYLETNHTHAIKRWIINYYLDAYKLTNLIESEKFREKKEEFKKKCYQELGIELADAINPITKKISKDDANILFKSIKTLANRGNVKIETYEVFIEYLAKRYDVTANPELAPTATDSNIYHTLYKIMRAIRLCYITSHIFSVLLDQIKINNFHLEWEGAYDRIILEDLNKKYLIAFYEYALENSLFKFNQLELILELTTAILPSTKEDSTSWVEQKLLNNKIIALDLYLYDKNGTKHAVAAIFWKDLVLFADRVKTVDNNLPGIQVAKINNLDCRKKIINELIKTRDIFISLHTYELLQKQLELTPIYQIAMFQQIKDNCAFASSAEPIHLGIIFIWFLQEFIKTKNLIDSCILAEEKSTKLHTEIMKLVYYKTVVDLIEFFKEVKIEFPKELFAHIYILNLYKIKSKKIEQFASYISWEDQLAAYEYYQNVYTMAIRNKINTELCKYNSKLIIPEEKFNQYGLFLAQSFLDYNADLEEFTKAVASVTRSALYGDIKINSVLLLGEFDLKLSSPNYCHVFVGSTNTAQQHNDFADHELEEIIDKPKQNNKAAPHKGLKLIC